MIVCNEKFFTRLENGELSAVERQRYMLCQTVQQVMEDAPVFYTAQPQGVKTPSVFVRIAKMLYHKKLGREIECTILFELKYLAENPQDDSECEQIMEKLLDAVSEEGCYQSVSAERIDSGALIKVACKLRWKVIYSDGESELMQSLQQQFAEE